MSAKAEEGQHHVLVIALQCHDFGRALLQVEDDLDRIARRRAAIDIVADEHHGVVRARSDRFHDCRELIGASVDIADREQTPLMLLFVAKHYTWFPFLPIASNAEQLAWILEDHAAPRRKD